MYLYFDICQHFNMFKVVQRRKNGSENFYRNWSDYKDGFNDLEGEFWLGK